MAFLQVEGPRQIYVEHYAGTGRPVVLVHGWALTTEAWAPVVSALLINKNEVVLLDNRCCGRSDRDFEDVSIEELGSDVISVIRHFNLQRPVLNGWSLGGAVVAHAAAELGSEIAGLVLTGGATPRYTAADDWPYGDTVEDVEKILVDFGFRSCFCLEEIGSNGLHETCRRGHNQLVVDTVYESESTCRRVVSRSGKNRSA